jgi:hypothetical protein
MGKARINIVGGDGEFFQRFVSAISLTQSVDGALEQSDALRALLADLMQRSDGESSALGAVLENLAASAARLPSEGRRT